MVKRVKFRCFCGNSKLVAIERQVLLYISRLSKELLHMNSNQISNVLDFRFFVKLSEILILMVSCTQQDEFT